jgi:hypothetical protein
LLYLSMASLRQAPVEPASVQANTTAAHDCESALYHQPTAPLRAMNVSIYSASWAAGRGVVVRPAAFLG